VADDYSIINPLGSYDCLNAEKSDIVYHDGKVVKVQTPVFDPDKLAGVPALFRIVEQPRDYFLNSDLLLAIDDIRPKPTNVFIFPVDVVPRR
jgi:hypothetical protein